MHNPETKPPPLWLVGYYSLVLPFCEPPSPWHPTESEGPFSVLSCGAFRTKAEAGEWAAEHLGGAPYLVRRVPGFSEEYRPDIADGYDSEDEPSQAISCDVGHAVGLGLSVFCRSAELFALKWPSGIFHSFCPNTACMSLCGDPPYYRVKLTPDPEGAYWTWHEFEKNEYRYTNHNRVGVEICFPYGLEIETTLGRGELIRVRVEELGVA